MMAITSVLTALLAGIAVQAAQNELQQILDFGPNPNNVGAYAYIPTSVVSSPALIVAIHDCAGSAQDYFASTQYADLADEHGFLVIYPDSPRYGKCFDVHTPETLTHDSGGDSQGVASVVTAAITTLGVNPQKVFVAGTGSGAMLVNVLAGSYPELFTAASAYSGVPFGCFAGPDEWNTRCANGNITMSSNAWGDLVRAAYSGYTGQRPRMMLWHGGVDSTVQSINLYESVYQWADVLNASVSAGQLLANTPEAGYVRTLYGSGSELFVISFNAQKLGHPVPVHESVDLDWFGITNSGLIPTTSEGKPVCLIGKYGQCGGTGWSGCTVCDAGSTCLKENDWISQCL